jgi:hypothetical protein
MGWWLFLGGKLCVGVTWAMARHHSDLLNENLTIFIEILTQVNATSVGSHFFGC